MRIGSDLKKFGKNVFSAVSDPKNLINPLFSVSELGENVYDDYKKREQEKKNREASQAQAEIEASNQAFQENLDKKRKSAKRSNVIFAGLLGGGANVGLGGQKSLLGL